MSVVLQTERLILRHFDRDDVEALHRITGDAEVMQFVGDLRPYTLEKTRRMIEEELEHYRRRGFGEYAVLAKDGGALVGFGGYAILPERTCVEIDYVLEKESWGLGLATEIAGALVHHGFTRLGFDALGTSFDPRNHASMRVAAKVGFRYERRGLDEFGLPAVYYHLAKADTC
jgi:[ribosomal protein S5]-alanine N-acetyltransferase